jgi:predicted permease
VYAVIVVTLALGIGVNTMFFTFFSGMVLRPLPFADPDRLVTITGAQPKLKRTQRPVSALDLRDWQAEARSFTAMAPLVQRIVDLQTVGTGSPERVPAAGIAAALFPLLGISPTIGRNFSKDDEGDDGKAVALISERVWTRRFNRDPAILGRTITLDHHPYDIVGVMPPGFQFPHVAEIWTPLARDPEREPRDRRALEVIGRLAPGRTVAQAQAEMIAIAERLEQAHPDTNTGWSARVRRLRDAWLPPVTQYSSIAQQVSVAFVLLIACANVATLMLARAASRRYEIALKVALGASRGRVIRQFLTEGVALALIGGTLGVAVAFWGDNWIRTLVQVPIPYWLQFPFDGRALAFALGLTLATGVGFSLGPALRHSRVNVADVLKTTTRTVDVAGGQRLRRLLVVGQVAMSAILLVGAFLMIKSFLRVDAADVGYQTADLLTLRVSLNGEAYKDPARRAAFVSQALARIGGLAYVRSAAAASYLPASPAGHAAAQIEAEGQVADGEETRLVTRQAVTQAYVDTMGIPLVEGRWFTADEIELGRGDLVVLGSGLAKQLWPGNGPVSEAIGRRIRILPRESGSWLTVIGIVGSVEPPYQIGGLDSWPRDQVYVPYGAEPTPFLSLVVKTRTDAASASTDLRTELQTLDATIPIYDVMTMTDVLRQVNWVPRLWSQLFSVFGLLALLMSAAGTYSMSAYAVSQRGREIAVRMALGARRGRILTLIVGDALRLSIVGTLLGLGVALPVSRLLARLLYEVTPNDPIVFGGVALLLTAVSIASAWLPARRAAHVDPMAALRAD